MNNWRRWLQPLQNDIWSLLAITTIWGLFLGRLFYPDLQIFFTPEIERSDITSFFLPTKHAAQEALRQFRLPLWEPRIANGYPLFAEGQSGILFLPNLILLLLLPLPLAWNLLYVLSIGSILVGTYVLLRTWSLTKTSSLLGAVSFGLSSYVVLHIIHINILQVMSIFPWMLWITHKIVTTPKPSSLLLIGLAVLISQQIFAGHLPHVFISLLGICLYLIPQLPHLDRPFTKVFQLGLSLVFGCGLAAIQLLPTIELIGHSSLQQQLGSDYVTHFELPWSHLFTLINPSAFGTPREATYFTPDLIQTTNSLYWENTFFIGWIPLLLASYYLYVNWRRRQSRGVLLMGAGALLLMTGSHSPLNFVFNLPIFSQVRVPSRYGVLLLFSLAALAAMGLDRLSRKHKLSLGPQLIIVSLASLQLLAFGWNQNGLVPAESIFQPPATATQIQASDRIITDISHTTEWRNHYLNHGWDQPKDYTWFANGLAASQNLLFNRIQLQGYTGLPINRSEQLYVAAQFDQLTRLADYTLATQLTPELSYASVSAIISAPKNDSVPDYILHKHTQSQPSFYLTSSHLPAQNLNQAAELISHSDNWLEIPIIETDMAAESPSNPGRVQLSHSFTTQTAFQTQSDSDQWLIWQQTYYPGWKATIDNQLTPIYPANISFQAVRVPAGSHTVDFNYQPTSFYWGTVISLGTCLLLIGWQTKKRCEVHRFFRFNKKS